MNRLITGRKGMFLTIKKTVYLNGKYTVFDVRGADEGACTPTTLKHLIHIAFSIPALINRTDLPYSSSNSRIVFD
jgi:hypothetical protein